jgi:hypothetical protein
VKICISLLIWNEKSFTLIKKSVKSSRFWPFFHPLTPLLTLRHCYVYSNEISLKHQMLKFRIRCTWFENNYNNNTCQSIENVAAVMQARKTRERYLCIEYKGKIRDEISFCTKIRAKSSFAPP